MLNAVLARTVVPGLVLATAIAGPALAAERPWIEVQSPHFTVVSNAGEAEGRDIAWQFEQGRSVFEALWPWARQEDDRPFVVFAARDEETLRALAPKYWEVRGGMRPAAVYVGGPGADFVALRTDLDTRGGFRVNRYQTAFEGYADNRIVRHFGGQVPLWFRRGLGEVFGNTLIREKDVEIGRVIPWHLDMLAGRATSSDQRTARGASEGRGQVAPVTRALIPLPRLLAVQPGDAEVTGETSSRYFAAQAWALVHYLMFGDGGRHRAQFNRVAALIRAGKVGDEATAALGDIAALTVGYRDYMIQRTYQYQRVDADIEIAKEKWPARPLPPAQAAAVQAKFHVAMNRPAEARALIAAARQADASLAASYEAEALLLAREGDGDGARAALARAEQLGSTSPWVIERLGGRPAPPRPSPAAPGGPDPIAACNAGDDAACGRLVPGLQAACDGDGAMCMALAFLYRNGRGVARDERKAEELYGRACEASQARACAARARMILARSAATADVAEARRLLERACAGGEASACGGADRK